MSGMTRCSWEEVSSLGGTMEEGRRHPTKPCACPNWSQRWGHNKVLQICICQDGRSRGRATHWPGPNHYQYYPGVRQPSFLALLISEISFFSPKFMQGLLDLPCAGIGCLDSVGVRNNSLKWLKMLQMQAMYNLNPLQQQRFTAFLVENHVSLFQLAMFSFPFRNQEETIPLKYQRSM